MEKLNQVVIMILAIFAIMCPMIVKADQIQLRGDAYSKYVAVGSEFIFSIEVGKNNFSGVVTFDNNVLEVTNVTTEYSGNNEIYAGSKGTVNKNVNGNQLTIDYVAGDIEENILVTFKVKSYPSNGTITVKVKSNNNQWFGEPSSTMKVVAEKQCPACEKDEVSCPVCKECPSCEVTADENVNVDNNSNANTNNNDQNNNDTLLYVSLGACGILAVAVVILAFKKK